MKQVFANVEELNAFFATLTKSESKFVVNEQELTIEFEPIPVLVIGRHTPEPMPGVEITGTRNVEFSTNWDICRQQFAELHKLSVQTGTALLFQNIPGILASVMISVYAWYAVEDTPSIPAPRCGVIVSVPGPRVAGVEKEYIFSGTIGIEDIENFAAAIKHANSRAKVEISMGEEKYSKYWRVAVTVDPVSPFKFDHVAWF